MGNGLNAALNGSALLDALGSVTGTLAHPYLVLIEPGIYDIVTRTLTMKPHVDVQGFGEKVTIIRSQGNLDFSEGTVMGAQDAELRFLTVVNTGGVGYYATAINNQGNSGFSVVHVRLVVLGGSSGNTGILNRENGSGAEMTVRDASIHLSDATNGGSGVYKLAEGAPSDMTLIDVSIDGSSPLDANFTGIRNSGPTSNPYSATVTAINVTAVFTSGTGYTYGLCRTPTRPPPISPIPRCRRPRRRSAVAGRLSSRPTQIPAS